MNGKLAKSGDTASERRFGYRDILDHLLSEIQGGRWPVGGAIVSEADLVNQFGTTRTTVRQALKELETLGYIKRRRGTRSILVSSEPSEDFVNSVRSIGELLQYSQRTKSKLLGVSNVQADQRLAQKLSVPAGGEWIRAEYLRNPLRGGLPIGYSEIYFDAAYKDIVDQLCDDRTIYSLLEDSHGAMFCRIEQEVQAAAADQRVAGILRVATGSPIMVVQTRFIAGSGVVAEVGLGYFPAGRFRFEMVLERSVGEKLD